MVFSILNPSRKEKTPPRTAVGQRLYAIGDIHGRLDLHTSLIEQIVEDAKSSSAQDHVLIYLGDYIDRGPDSRHMIETLNGPPPDGFRAHYLMGNHEDMLLQFIDGIGISRLWLNNGGKETLEAYGCTIVDNPRQIRRELGLSFANAG